MLRSIVNKSASRFRAYSFLSAVIIVAVGAVLFLVELNYANTQTPATGQHLFQLIQNGNPNTTTVATSLDRLSWGSVIAGAIIALIVQFTLNLLGIALGITSLNPEYGEDGASPKALGTSAAIWVGVTTLIALFIGGLLAARFAGIPNRTDGMLHGLMTWGVVMLVSLFLLTTVVGRIFSGMATVVGQGLHLANLATQGMARGVAAVGQTAIQGAGAGVQGMQNIAQDAAQTVRHTAQTAAYTNPQVANAMNQMPSTQDLSFRKILQEATTMLQQAGISPDQVQNQAQGAAQEVQGAVRQAVQNPAEAGQTLEAALQRVLQRGQSVTSQADRQALVDMMAQRGHMSPQQAEEQLRRWEGAYQQAQQQAQTVVQQAQDKVEDVKQQAQDKVEQVRDDVQRMARDTAEATTKAISRLALIAFAAIVFSALAAGFGGAIGAPDTALVRQDVVPTGMIQPASWIR